MTYCVRRAAVLEVRPEVQAAYGAELQRRLRPSVWNAGGCASWYLDDHGRNPTLRPDYTWRFVLRTRTFDRRAYMLEPASSLS